MIGNVIDRYGNTPLIRASSYGQLSLIELLINTGADINFETKYGYTALMWASIEGQYDAVKMLIYYGANIHIKNLAGHSALTWALRKKHLDIVKLLRKREYELELIDEKCDFLIEMTWQLSIFL